MSVVIRHNGQTAFVQKLNKKDYNLLNYIINGFISISDISKEIVYSFNALALIMFLIYKLFFSTIHDYLLNLYNYI